MSKGKTKIKVDESLLKNKIKEIKKASRDAVKEYKKQMTDEYVYCISTFYAEYEPKYYYRHFNNDYSTAGIMASGLGHTSRPYYHDNGRKIYGGIFISPEYMYSDYSDRNMAFNTFFGAEPYSSSWHGNPKLGISSSIHVRSYMDKADEKIYEKISQKLDDDIMKILSGGN